MSEEAIPAPKDDDPEEVADKLSIATAMWSRGEKADALTWLRRAAESASDAELDMRALELAKAASSLAASLGSTSVAPPANAPAPANMPAAKQPTPPASRPATAPPPSRPATASPPKPPASQLPRAPMKPPTTRPGAPGALPSKLAPLPPLRPLGTATPQGPIGARKSSTNLVAAKPAEMPQTPRPPSVTPSPTMEPPKTTAETPQARTGAESPDFEQTTTLPVADAAKLIASSTSDAVEEPRPRVEVHDVEQARKVLDEAPSSSRVTKPQDEPIPPSFDDARLTNPIPRAAASIEMPMPLAIGMRVRIYANDQGAWVVPEHEGGDASGGVLAILVPVREEDDLRALFQRIPQR